MEINAIACRSILTRTTGYLKEVCSHSLNPYAGCGFGRSACGEACYVRFNTWITKGRRWGGFVDVKTNAAAVYAQTVGKEKKWAHARGVAFGVFLSSSTDPWQPVERRFRITRQLLGAFLENPPDTLILQTHSTSILDDVATIEALSRRCDLRVQVSLEGDRDRLPGLAAPPSSLEARMHLLEELSRRGLATVACLAPLYPLREPEAFFARLSRTGIRAVVIDHFIEGDGSVNGARTLRTPLPEAMANVNPLSVTLSYRDRVAGIAMRYLPVGISAAGFAGRYSH